MEKETLMLRSINNNTVVNNDTFKWILVEVNNTTTLTNSTLISHVSSLGYNQLYFIDEKEFVNSS